MPDESALHRVREFLDRADDAYAHALWVGGAQSQAWATVVAQARERVVAGPETAEDDLAATASSAELAVAEAILAQARSLPPEPVRDNGSGHGDVVALMLAATGSAARLPRLVADEIAHIFDDRPRSILVRLALTLAISVSLVLTYHLFGWATYDAKSLTIYLFSAIAGSVVCTNALCFDARRVRAKLAAQQPLWRILIVKNIAMAALIAVAAVPVVALLAVGTDHPNPLVIVDQLVAMLFIWLGVANVLSVLSPLRRESLAARLTDGTWLPYLLSFGISYGVGLTVNLMIYWRLWARHAAAHEVVGGAWAAFLLVLVSSMMSWVLLTVFAVAAAHHPVVRRVLVREMR
ncbi:MAG: hypothetical protein WBA05_04640 [Gordonia sp. (in: high G+C Gram-positive bacteria)]|uniref:hypothetical protein n=1 Tax=Gordonia TaxID=2053 RepID=UPI003267CA53